MSFFNSFIAIDYETANSKRCSACSVAAIKYDLQTGVELDRVSSLINPEEEFDDFNIMIHGIYPFMVENAPIFPSAMNKVFCLADQNTLFVAHNAAFDMSVMRSAALKYQSDIPDIFFSCTYRLAKQLLPELITYTLPDIAEYCKITGLNHHDAESDAETCGKIFFHFLKGFSSVEEMLNSANLKIGRIENGLYDGIHQTNHEHKPALKHIHDLPNYTKGDESPFFGKTVVFTGAMKSMTREEAEKIILDIGGTTASGVSKKINYLITGYQDPRKLKGKEKSKKVVEAEKLLAAGSKIEVIPEEEFLKLL